MHTRFYTIFPYPRSLLQACKALLAALASLSSPPSASSVARSTFYVSYLHRISGLRRKAAMDPPDRSDFLSPTSRKMFARVLRDVADALEAGAAREQVLGLCGSMVSHYALELRSLMLA